MSRRQKLKKTISTPRVLTGLGLGIVTIAVLMLGSTSASLFFFAIAIFGSYEIAKITHPDASKIKIYAHIIVGGLPFIILNGLKLNDEILLYLIVATCAIFVLFIVDLYRDKRLDYKFWSYAMCFFYWGMSFGLAAHHVRFNVDYLYNEMIGIIAILWTSDTMAYVSGRKYGKNRLFPSVSPNKTIEGTLGSGLSCVIMAALIAMITDQNYMRWFIISITIWVLGAYGDLIESKFKRTQGVKDSGNILPGHGGFLDRFDSLAYILPFLLLWVYLFEK